MMLTILGFLLSSCTGSWALTTGRAQLSNAVIRRSWGSSVLKMSTLSETASIDLTKNGGVMKQVLVKGEGKSVEVGDILAAEYWARVKGSESPFAMGDQEQFIASDGTMIKGWDVAIQSMKIGETARFCCSPSYAYGAQGVSDVIPPDAEIEVELKLLAWLGNQLRPESLFQKDLDIDPFIASTPEKIQAEYDEMQAQKEDKYAGNIIDIYLRRLKNISFGFGGSNFFASQSGERPPWYLNPNLTFPAMILFVLVGFATVLASGAVREKGVRPSDLDVASAAATATVIHSPTSTSTCTIARTSNGLNAISYDSDNFMLM